MTTSTLERPVADTAAGDHGNWTCDNCEARTSAVRKRCADCGTSRY